MTGFELALWLVPALFGGASAYLAIMALAGFAPAEMKPIALVLAIAGTKLAYI